MQQNIEQHTPKNTEADDLNSDLAIASDSTNSATDEAPAKSSGSTRKWAKLKLWARRVKFWRRAELLVATISVISAVATYFAMTRDTAPLEATAGKTLQYLLRVNGILLLALMAILSRWFISLWSARRSKAPGSRLHTKVTGVFIAIAILPPIIMAVFSALFLEFGIQTWFSEKVRTTLNSSLEVADAYMIEHRTTIKQDLAAIALAYSRLSPLQQRDTAALQQVGETALGIRLLSELIVIEERDGEGSILARADQNLQLQTSRIQMDLIERAKSGEAVIALSEADSTVVGIVRLSNFFRPTYLYIARNVNPEVLGYLQSARSAVDDYENLEGERSDILLQFNVIFIIVALLVLLAAVWLGLWFSSRLVTPISDLVDAAERIGRGDLSVRVTTVKSKDEIGTLSRTFNRMTNQLKSQQDDLKDANITLDERRRFLEGVLEGVSAGVLGLDGQRMIFAANRACFDQLSIHPDQLIHQQLDAVLPVFQNLVEKASTSKAGTAQGQIVTSVDGTDRTLLARVATTRSDTIDGISGPIEAYVVTFDDLTDQITNQRTAAWADVARRIAHEIKNPLTPIQLSAERLKRKYSKEIQTDPSIFNKCTETIIRQVGDLRQMVDEFSSFARMPAPVYKPTDVNDIVKHAVFMQSVSWPKITFNQTETDKNITIDCDGRLLGQAFTNVLKNAAESIDARIEQQEKQGQDCQAGEIAIDLQKTDHNLIITISDNGRGLPKDQKHRLMEPYVTTRAKGTGLGLAIVKRIIEEHGGTVTITDNEKITPQTGAKIIFNIDLDQLENKLLQHSVSA